MRMRRLALLVAVTLLAGSSSVGAQGGRTIASVFASKDGRYSISLTVGTYAVAVALQRPPIVGRGLEPSMVRVVAGPPHKRDFTIDTGIR